MPCPCRVDCPGTDSPFANLSSEPPDRLIFIGNNWGWDQNIPPLGWHFTNTGCLGICESTVSQEEADFCAAQQQFECLPGDPGGGGTVGPGLFAPTGPGGGWTTPGNFRPSIFRNAAAFCTVLCQDGLPFTYTVRAGLFSAFNQQQADEIAISYACKLANLNSVCFSSISGACLNQNYLSVISVTGGFAPYSIRLIGGTLPPGVGFVQDTGTTAFLSGIPTVSGAFTFTLLARDTKGNFMQKDFTCYVLDVSNKDSIPLPSVGTFYNFQLAGTGGVAPYTFSNAVGLPGGLTLQSDGFITGNPIAPIGTGFTCTMTDAAGHVCIFPLTYKSACAFGAITWNVPPASDSSAVAPSTSSRTISYPTTHSIEMNGTVHWVAPVAGNAQYGNSNSNSPISFTALTADTTCTVTINVKSLSGYVRFTLAIFDGTFTNLYLFVPPTAPTLGITTFNFTIPSGGNSLGVSVTVQWGNPVGATDGAADIEFDFGI